MEANRRRELAFALYIFLLYCDLSIGKECGGHQKGFIGMFTSPSYPSNYDNGILCDWRITSVEGTKIQLRFSDFNFEQSDLCKYDYIEVYDGNSMHAPLKGRFCGSEIKDVIISTDRELYILMKTDGADSGRGFEASWIAVDQRFVMKSSLSRRQNSDICGPREYTSKEGEIKSPGFPTKYPSSTQCVWVIETDADHEIALKFEEFYLEAHSECRYDYVIVKGGRLDAKQRYCGKNSPSGKNTQKIIKSLGNKITIEFTSDSSTEQTGFRASWITKRKTSVTPSDCGGTLTGESGTITSPHYPKPSLKRAICTWKITVPEGGRIKFEFVDLSIQDHLRCSTGYVQVRNRVKSGYESLGTFCGTVPPSPLKSTGNIISVGYLSDKNRTTRGFQAKWSTFYQTDLSTDGTSDKETPCNKRLTSTSGQIVHKSSTNCSWLIELAPNYRGILSMDEVNMADDPTCTREVFEARDGRSPSSPILFRTCGSLKPRPVMTSANYIYVTHRVLRSRQASHMKLRWESVDTSTSNDIFNPGSCIISSLDDIKLKADIGKTRNKNVKPAHVPWMVKLDSRVHCAGAIITPEWIMSAAHCFKKLPSPSEWTVRAGDPDLFANEDTEQIRKITKIYFNPKYNPTNFDNDIVLLRLEKRLVFSRKVKSICLPDKNENLTPGQECAVAGWGTDKYLSKPREKLLQVFPKIVSERRCNSRSVYNGKITGNMICAGMRGFDSCQGDGGSPLVCVNAARKYFAIGLTSWGNGCAGKYGVYTDIRKQIDWMKSVINQNKNN